MTQNPICIFHSPCTDGFGSAWVVRKYFKASGYNVEFHPAKYGESPPDVRGRAVYIVDFSYKREVLKKMADDAAYIVILDHHKTARDDLSGLESERLNVRVEFDMNRSGARITWDHFFPNQEPPLLLQHIEDRDLWRFALPYTKEITANLFSYEYDFAIWDWLMYEADRHEQIADGSAIQRKQDKDVRELVNALKRPMRIGGHIIMVANIPYTLVSEAAGMMAKDELFSACYWDTPNSRVFGLRSIKGYGLDVADIAKQYGGGGHANASGMRLSYTDALELEVNPLNLSWRQRARALFKGTI